MTQYSRTAFPTDAPLAFSADGFLLGTSAISRRCHVAMILELERACARHIDPAHSLMDLVPLAQRIVDDPIVAGAVAAALGDASVADPCRHVHLNTHPAPGGWHRDDYCGVPFPRAPRRVLVCYFPQDTPLEMGPTSVLRGSHRWPEWRPDGEEVAASGHAGTFLVAHHALWHRATANVTGRQRYMLKLLFAQSTKAEARS